MFPKTASLLIIGGGPAGCAAAISAINEGINDVLIIEKEPENRHRIGEILLTQTVIEFNKLGIAEDVKKYADKFGWGRKYAAAYVYGKDRTPWKVQNNHPLASEDDQPHIPRCFVDNDTKLWFTLMVKRHEFDESLREIAIKKGVKIIHGSVRDIHVVQEDNKFESTIAYVEVEAEEGEKIKIYPQFIIDASGQNAVIARKMKTRHIVDDWNLQAKYSYFKNVDFENAMNHGLFKDGANILSFEDGWSWVAHLGNDVTSIGVVSKNWSKDDNYWSKLKNLPEYYKFGLDKAITVDYKGNETDKDHFYTHPNYRFRSEVMRGRNWACSGDAAMFLDPLLSQGVTLAISFGAQLGKIATSIINGDGDFRVSLEKYERSYISELEVLNKVVTQWYDPSFKFDKNWEDAASKISTIFGREIGTDVEQFRWISNLENINYIHKDKNDNAFLKKLNDVNEIKMIHDFEKYEIIKT